MGDFEKIVLLVQNVILGSGIVGLALIGLILVFRFQLGIVRSTGQRARQFGGYLRRRIVYRMNDLSMSGLESLKPVDEENEMKVSILTITILFGPLLLGDAALSAPSHQETNHVVRALLDVSSRMDPAGIRGTPRKKINFRNADDFFSCVDVGEDWTRENLRAAFSAEILRFATINYQQPCHVLDAYYADLAVNQCRLMNYTNALSSLSQLAINPSYPSQRRIRAIRAVIELEDIGETTDAFVENIMTNKNVFTVRERSMALDTYAQMVCQEACSNLVQRQILQSAVSRLYRNRFLDWENSFWLDEVFVTCLDGYSTSSNRLEFASYVLGQTNCWSATRSRFIAVTNSLLSSGQPLRWITVGDSP